MDPLSGDETLRRSGASIIDGKYSIPEEKGPNLGTYSVRFSSMVGTGKFITHGTDKDEVKKESLPAQYTQNSDTSIEIKSGLNTFDFHLTKP